MFNACGVRRLSSVKKLRLRGIDGNPELEREKPDQRELVKENLKLFLGRARGGSSEGGSFKEYVKRVV